MPMIPTEDRKFAIAAFSASTALYLLSMAQMASEDNWFYKPDISLVVVLQGTMGALMGRSLRPAVFGTQHKGDGSSLPAILMGSFIAILSSLSVLDLARSHSVLHLSGIGAGFSVVFACLWAYTERHNHREYTPPDVNNVNASLHTPLLDGNKRR